MPETYIDRSLSFLPSLINISGKYTSIFLLFYIIFFFPGCAHLHRAQKPVDSISQTEKENLISLMETQESIVSKFYFSGKIIVNGWIWDSTANIFIAGVKDPFSLKIEVTHSWGKPVIHLLAKENRLEITDFSERKHYIGGLDPDNLSKFFPDMYVSPATIWSLLRGYPCLHSCGIIQEKQPETFTLKDRDEKTIEHIKFSPEKRNIESLLLSTRSLNMKFDDFRNKGDIYYAEKTVLKGKEIKRDMTIIRKDIIFNEHIPDEIFSLIKPQSFEFLYFGEMVSN